MVRIESWQSGWKRILGISHGGGGLVLCSQSLFRFADLGMMDCAEAVQTKGVGLSFLRSM